jgi:hypothetical protein
VAGDYYAAQGSVTFLISSVVKDAAGNVVFDRIPIRAVLDADGQFTTQLLATDDPALSPEGLTYTVTERIRGAESRDPWLMEVPLAAAGVGIDMADVVPATAGPQVFTYELASAHAADIAALQEAIDGLGGGGGGLTVEQIQDLVATMTTDTSSIDFVYNDVAGTITAAVKAGSVTEAMLSFTVATQAELDAEATARAAGDAAAVQRANHTGTQAASTITGLATVATSGAYADLAGKPTLGTAAAAATSDFDPAGSAAAAQAAAIAASQPLDSDLTAIAALSTTSYGRALLALADAAALRSAAGLGTAATQAATAFDSAGAAAAAQAASQPLDSDLTAIAALTTTSFGRSFLELANAAGARTLLGLGTAATVNTGTASGDVPLLGTGGRLDIARLASGTPDGTKFVRDDGTLAAPAGGSSAPARAYPVLAPRSGDYVGPPLVTTGTNAPNTVNRMAYLPLYFPTAVTVTGLRINVVVAAAAGGVARLGLYASDSTGRPTGTGPISGSEGTVATTSTGAVELTVSVAIAAGLYWAVAVPQVATATLAGYLYGSIIPAPGSRVGEISGGSPLIYLQTTVTDGNSGNQAAVSGALPAPVLGFNNNGGASAAPIVLAKVA